jgi:hypothetical protein
VASGSGGRRLEPPREERREERKGERGMAEMEEVMHKLRNGREKWEMWGVKRLTGGALR